jgi:hypothetical protein
MCIVFRRENAKDIVVFMHRFAVVSPLNGIPPVGIWISVLAFQRKGRSERRIGVVAVLQTCQSSVDTLSEV